MIKSDKGALEICSEVEVLMALVRSVFDTHDEALCPILARSLHDSSGLSFRPVTELI